MTNRRAIPFMMDMDMEEMMMLSYGHEEEEGEESESDDDEEVEDCKPPAVVMRMGTRGHDSNDRYSDRHAFLNRLDTNCAKGWKDLPPMYQVDKEFILKALTFDKLPSKSDFERKFPQSLRFDRDVVLAFTARHDFDDLYYERHLFVPDCLTNDKEVMMAYCQKIPRSLQECSEELCKDKELVLAAVQTCGLELQYASINLREDKEVVMAACQNDGRALEFCPPGAVRKELTSDRDFMLSVLQKHGGPMLRIVAEPLKRDRQLLLEALKHGMRLRFCPFEFQTEKEFLLETLERRSELYLEMNRNVQADRELAFAAICSESSTQAVMTRALEHVPYLSSNRDVVLAICKRGDAEFVFSFLAETADNLVKDDKEIMLTAIQRDPKIFRQVSGRLQRDVEIIMASLAAETASDVLTSVGSIVQTEHPEITVQAINVASLRCLRLVRLLVPEALWLNRQVAIAWIRRSGRTLDAFDSLLETDEEMAMEVAEHAWHDFGRVGAALRSNVAFMTRAVDKNGRVFRYAAREIRQDLDLAVRAIASHPDALGSSAAEGTALFGIDRNAVRDHVQSKLDLHTTFVRDFLRGIAINKPHLPPARRSQLPMLDRGVETSEAFKRLIAEFLGVPVGANLKVMRTAMRNLTTPPTAESSIRTRSAAAMDDVDFRAFDHHAERWARRRLLRRRMRDLPADRVVIRLGENNDNNAPGAPIAPRMADPMPHFAVLGGAAVVPPPVAAVARMPYVPPRMPYVPPMVLPPLPGARPAPAAVLQFGWGRAAGAVVPPVAAGANNNNNIDLRAEVAAEVAALRGLEAAAHRVHMDIRAEAAAIRGLEAAVMRRPGIELGFAPGRGPIQDEVEALRLAIGGGRDGAAAVAVHVRPPAVARRGPRADLRRRFGVGDLFDEDDEEEMFALMMEAGMDEWDEPLI